MQQNEALSLLKMGANVFLTGAAGSGKTYLLNQYINYLKEHNVPVAMTASTGIAATHLQGSTLHSWSGIGIKDNISPQDLERLHKNKRIKSNYKKTKVLIIDEISMLHKHQLDMVDFIARSFLDPERVFGGLQVIVCGDFFQLPPVSSGLEEEKQFAYEASVWNDEHFKVCYLHEQYRQSNDPLLTVLNDIRNGTAGEHTKVPLRTRYKKEPEGATKATKLYTRNINVDWINDRELARIQGQEKIFTMVSQGFDALVEGLKSSCLAHEQLKLKIGAEVMFIKNHPQGKYVNGTRCVVVGFEKSGDAWPVVKTYDNRIITACAEDWVFEDNGIVRASITQVPLRLAWALTIHKSQGMTLDAAEIDLGDAFEPGMGYVALSRIRSLNGLKLMNLNEMALKVHPKILQQDQLFKDSSAALVKYLHNLSEEETIQSQQTTLFERFEGGTVKKSTKRIFNKEAKKPTHIITLELLKNKLSISGVAEQRGLSSGTVLGHVEKLKGLKLITNSDIEHLKEGLSQNEFDLIFTELAKSEDGKLTPLVEAFEGKYSYDTIKLVRLFYEGKSQATQSLS
ncbi:AAA family ATPase [Legionella shakespearei]|uniref:ATP-dependent RecD-like DNA helicase n=1 Tax=Legionella shakespearei DSM 23087 TaxID=1122169 RepID=A0A0W0YLL5_9GAMM|nr:AAA family ATPase [Legionella shakespearei]KTD57604.1 ATP-dependent RecD-like DNA helicase [Legionella shakespearei DSM 23087]